MPGALILTRVICVVAHDEMISNRNFFTTGYTLCPHPVTVLNTTHFGQDIGSHPMIIRTLPPFRGSSISVILPSELVKPTEHFIVPLETVPMVQNPMVLIRENHQATRNAPPATSRSQHQPTLRSRIFEWNRNTLLQSMEGSDPIGHWEAVVLAPMDNQLRSRPFMNVIRWAGPALSRSEDHQDLVGARRTTNFSASFRL